MSQLSNYAEHLVLNLLLRGQTFTTIPTVYACLYLTDPTDSDIGTEVNGGSYARQSVIFSAPANGLTQNVADLQFPTATLDWGDINAIGIRDSVSSGNLLFYGALVESKRINAGDIIRLLAGNIVCGAD